MHVMLLRGFNLCCFLDDPFSVQNGIAVTCYITQTDLVHVTVTSETSLMTAVWVGDYFVKIFTLGCLFNCCFLLFHLC